ncbi:MULTISPECIES: PTS sugar transporter subunit IIC [Pseudodesulfovibrio]|uniref:PTS sugar transporter subunit IIC n=1 Tax=Pseudodesulfovibrio TaxID=2035811 RepID=UPI0022A91BC3|nr:MULTISPECIES: PTS sugar transporter subunit IIC [Pseudodesulfovibrio]
MFSLFRFALTIGLLERPLVIGLFWGLATGDMETSLCISIFFELFWLDLIPVGTYIPPHLTVATFVALSLTTYFGLDQPGRISFVLFASMPLAWLGTRLEALLREQDRSNYNRLLNWVRNPKNPHLPSLIVMRSVGRTFVLSGLAFYVAVIALMYAFKAFFALYPSRLDIGVTWPHLWVAATLGGLMALRLKRAYAVLAAGIFLFMIFIFWGRF